MQAAYTSTPPLSLYIHLPWCVKKCPYCDFNSHAVKTDIPQEIYLNTLIRDLEQDLSMIHGRKLTSIFIGGGTPSLFAPKYIAQLLNTIDQRLPINNIEITMEANPGTVEQKRFEGFHKAGINRISLGIQSLQDEQLKTLGRIHSAEEAKHAVQAAERSGFANINCDLMFGLPEQTIEDALFDLNAVIALNPQHISWYQLTIEPNTLFHHQKPKLPDDEIIWQMQEQGQQLLNENNFTQYEVSAYANNNRQCQHNLNYWEFGDYLGIGAGAHGKITDPGSQQIIRYWKIKHPNNYLMAKNFYGDKKQIPKNDLAFEFMLNALRLQKPILLSLFTARTFLDKTTIKPILKEAQENHLLHFDDKQFELTQLGHQFLNDVVEMFLNEQLR